MTKTLFQVLVTQFLFIKVMSSYVHQYSSKPYIVRESAQIPQRAYITEHKTYQNYPQNYAYPAYKIAEPVVIPARPSPLPEPIIPKAIAVPKSLETPTKCSGNLDSHVLNNLAIALQLLIVNNIINNPPEPNPFISPLTDSVLELAFSPNKLVAHEEFQMPNSKFLGSSNFGADVMSKAIMGLGSVTSPRAGLALMSPYDAIANLPLSESIASNYMTKRDFQSPYSAIMAADNNRDLFSIADFF